MNNKNIVQAVQSALKAVYMVVGDTKLQEKLQDEARFNEVLNQFDLPQNSRQALLNIITRVEHIQSRPPVINNNVASSDTKKMLLESFGHIRWSFWISLVMSVVLFLVGLFSFGMALIRSFNECAVSSSTLTIAGLGVADFVLLFYTRPWQDISVNLSNSQQVKIIATSYLSGLSLLKEGEIEKIKSLEQLTKSSVGLLEEFTEERSPILKGKTKGADNDL